MYFHNSRESVSHPELAVISCQSSPPRFLRWTSLQGWHWVQQCVLEDGKCCNAETSWYIVDTCRCWRFFTEYLPTTITLLLWPRFNVSTPLDGSIIALAWLANLLHMLSTLQHLVACSLKCCFHVMVRRLRNNYKMLELVFESLKAAHETCDIWVGRQCIFTPPLQSPTEPDIRRVIKILPKALNSLQDRTMLGPSWAAAITNFLSNVLDRITSSQQTVTNALNIGQACIFWHTKIVTRSKVRLLSRLTGS